MVYGDDLHAKTCGTISGDMEVVAPFCNHVILNGFQRSIQLIYTLLIRLVPFSHNPSIIAESLSFMYFQLASSHLRSIASQLDLTFS